MLELIIVLALVGVGLYFLNVHAPIVQWMKTLINVIVLAVVVVYVLQGFGIIGPLPIGHRWR